MCPTNQPVRSPTPQYHSAPRKWGHNYLGPYIVAELILDRNQSWIVIYYGAGALIYHPTDI